MEQLVAQLWEQVGVGGCQPEGYSLEQDPEAGHMKARCFAEAQLTKVELGALRSLSLEFAVAQHSLVLDSEVVVVGVAVDHNRTKDSEVEAEPHNWKVSFAAESSGLIEVVPEVPRSSITHPGPVENMYRELDQSPEPAERNLQLELVELGVQEVPHRMSQYTNCCIYFLLSQK